MLTTGELWFTIIFWAFVAWGFYVNESAARAEFKERHQ